MGCINSKESDWSSRLESYWGEKWWEDKAYKEKVAEVKICSRKVPYVGGFILHHFLLCKVEDLEELIIAEWTTENNLYLVKEIDYKDCLFLGKYTIKEIKNAIDKASDGKTYSWSNYNCNQWTENVASELGKVIKLSFKCHCSVKIIFPQPFEFVNDIYNYLFN